VCGQRNAFAFTLRDTGYRAVLLACIQDTREQRPFNTHFLSVVPIIADSATRTLVLDPFSPPTRSASKKESSYARLLLRLVGMAAFHQNIDCSGEHVVKRHGREEFLGDKVGISMS